MAPCTRLALVAVSLALLGGCGIIFPGATSCPDLDEVCPDLQCDDYKQNRDGCSICECEGAEEPGAVCWDASDCTAGQRCDVVNFCEPAPNCTDDGPCPDACYGRCVDAPASCTSDSDCAEGQICSFFSNERPDSPDGDQPAPGGGNGSDPAPPPTEPAPESGVCQDVSCGDADVALPECPPGSELVFESDSCGPICLPVDGCRELLPEECLSFPGCELIEEGCGCEGTEGGAGQEPAPCDCASIERCVAIDDCSALPIDQCESNPNCVLKAIGDGNGGSSDPGDAPAPPCECDPNAPDCTCEGGGAVPPPPEEQLVCVPRGADGTCLSDADCLAGEICELTTVCGSGCTVDDDGEEHCFEECWSERGVCLASENTCFDLSPDECLADPRCELADDQSDPCFCDPADVNCAPCDALPASSCRPRDGTCTSDFDCLEGQHCEVVESCPACDPSSNDIDCLAPCFVEGSCVDGTPPPVPCTVDADCGIGSTCVAVSVCEACGGSGGGNGGAEPPPDPAPCDPVCRDESVCVQTDPVCFSDADCSAAEFCDFSQLGCGVPGGLVAQCPGLCVALESPALCQNSAQCAAGERCATELDSCFSNPDAPDSGCWTVCVDDTATDGAFCLSDDECATDAGGATCRFQADVCLDDPSNDLALCSGWCAGACAEVETPATDPSTGQCAVFPDSCIPPGWVAAQACP